MSAAQNLTIGTLAVVGVGKVVKEDEFSVKVFMAGGFLLLGLSALDNVDSRLATGFAACIFSTAMYLYFPDIAKIFTNGNGRTVSARQQPVIDPVTGLYPIDPNNRLRALENAGFGGRRP